jgi:DNA mismatch repair protein MutS
MSSANEARSIKANSENESANSNSVCAAQTAETLANATPAMRQYFEVKAAHTDCLVFYRMGDFYELFFDDALAAASILDIALTKRGKHAGEEIPMCGVPVHAADMYLQKLIASGRHVAICEQMETPEQAKKRGAKEVVRREVVRIVTPGTITEEALLAPTQSHYLASLWLKGDVGAVSWLELSTGEFQVATAPLAQLPALLARLSPRELLLPQMNYDTLFALPWFHEWRTLCAIRPLSGFDAKRAERTIGDQYEVANSSVLGEYSALELAACGALLDYVKLTQLDALARLDAPKRETPDASLQMDGATRRNLELVTTQAGQRAGSLLSVIDKAMTAPGSRLLAQWLNAPLRDLQQIAARQDAVTYLLENASTHAHWVKLLQQVPDMERAVGRLSLERGGPRDLLSLAQGLKQANDLHETARVLTLPTLLRALMEALAGHHFLADDLSAALSDSVPMLARDGNFVRAGYRADLDEWRRLRDESKRVLAAMEQRLKKETDIGSLKIKYNNVLGYFIEITQIHEKKVPADFIHRQSLAGSLRYTTPELNDTARAISEAGDKALALELLVYAELRALVLAKASAIIAAARALATIDVLASFVDCAQAGNWVRPSLVSEPILAIHSGRHPVVEAALRREHKEFIANDCYLENAISPSPLAAGAARPSPSQRERVGAERPGEGGSIWLITGPNMGGKSTFLRQQALLVVLAQMGSFVPAAAATIGICDKLFCRVGAGDDLARGQSTFMVEMVETASILHQATAQSLVVLDEIGRGTATYDGVSLAWAVAEHLHNSTQCRALFATHYHELTALAQSLPQLKNYHATAKEYKGELIFMHRIEPGFADKSYGIHVAALAGMPKPVLVRAKQLLATLESGHSLTEDLKNGQLPLFCSVPSPEPETAIHPLVERLANIDVDELSPRQALDLVVELKNLADG